MGVGVGRGERGYGDEGGVREECGKGLRGEGRI